MKNKTEIWAVPADRIESFLFQNGAVFKEDYFFLPDEIRVSVSSLEDKMIGALAFPQTRVFFNGYGAAFDDFYQKFLLEFLAGGG